MTVSREDIHNLFAEAFPARAERASLEYVQTVDRPNDKFAVVLRLIIWDEHEGTLSIRDVKEQEVWFDPRGSSLERLQHYIKALTHVLSLALAQTEKMEVLMPHELLDTSPLKLAKAQTDVHFVRALEQKSRLGKYLPATG